MKKIYLLFCICFLMLNARGQQLIYEPFNYTPHATLGLSAQSSAVWQVVNTGDSILVDNGSLSYTGLLTSTGNKVKYDASGTDYYRDFTSQTSGIVYESFILNISSLGGLTTTGGYFTGLIQSGSTTAFGAAVWTRLSTTAGKYNVGISTRSNSAVSWLSTDLDPTTPCFIVSAYEIVAGTGNDVAKIWLNTPAIGGGEPAPGATAVPGTDLSSAARVFLRQDNATNTPFIEVDEIRIGTTWASVTPGSATSAALSAGTVADFGNVTVSTNSTSQSFSLSGSNLTGAPGTITITAPSTDFQVSNDNSSFGSSTTIAFASATLAATNVYVRFTPQSAGLKSGNVSISGGGATASVSVSGTGVSAAPPSAPVATAATAITGTSFTANWNTVSGTTGYWLDVYTLTSGSIVDTVVGWNFLTGTIASQTADEGSINNIGMATIQPTGSVLTASPYPGGPTSTTGTNPFSVNASGWDNGADSKYWMTTFNSTGATNLTLSSLQGSSNTGPKDFKIQYRIGAAGAWTDITGGTVTFSTAVAAGNVSTWAGVTNLALPAAADNQPLVSIRWIQTSNVSVNNSAVAAGGTSRISAVYVKGTVGGGSTPLYVPGYQNLSVGNVTSYNVTGLSNNTTYYYVVRAANANGTSANSNEITVTTTASATPAITTTALTAFGNVCTNITAGPNSFTINGTNLAIADITVGPLAGFTFSTTSGGTYTNSLTLAQTGGTYSQAVFVKFSPVAVQSYSGNIPVSGGGVVAPVNVAASGAGVNSAPSVTTGASSAITTSSATLAGNISATGCTAITAYGIEYSTTNGFVNGTGTQAASTNLSAGNFSSDVVGLAPATTYYYKAYATNSGGTTYGLQQSFTTASLSPSISVSALTAFGNVCLTTTAGPNSFTITGTNLTAANVDIAALAGYTYSITSGGTYTATLSLTQPGGSFSQQVFVKFTPVAVQSYNGNIAVNGGGIAAPVNVAASGAGINSAPSVTTGASSAITTTTATLAGSITATGCTAVTVYGIEYSLTNGFANGTGTPVTSANLSGGNYTSAVSGLAASTTYYYKAYATNAGGTAYGTQQSFTTAAPPPPAMSATTLTGFGAVCDGTTAGPNSFTLTGSNLTTANVTVGPLPGYSFSTTSGGTYTASLSITQPGGTFSQAIFVKFFPVVTQSYNGNIPVGGAGVAAFNVAVTGSGVFTTPTVTTGSASNITTSSAKLSGTVGDIGCGVVNDHGIYYSTINGFANGTGDYLSAGSVISNASFSVTLNNLVPGATYYYKAYARNSGGTAYGAQQSFTVAAIPAEFRIFPVPAERGSSIQVSMGNLKPGYYGLLFFNSSGALVYQENINIQSTYINLPVVVPATLATGVYRIQLVNNFEAIATKTIFIGGK